MKTFANSEIENYVAGLSDFQRPLVMKFRETVLSADERVKEGIKWGSIAFFNQKNICGFRVAKAHVTLLFMEGAKLEDKEGILNGDGAKARTVRATRLEEVPEEALADLVRQALELGM